MDIDPNNAYAWYNRGRYKIKINDIDNALVDLNKAIEIDKDIINFARQDKNFERGRDNT